jgi:hypothetical protein
VAVPRHGDTPDKINNSCQTRADRLNAKLNVGNDRSRLLSVLTVLIPFIGYPRTLNALRALDEIAPAEPN